VAADGRQHAGDPGGSFDLAAQHPGADDVVQQQPRAVHPFLVVERQLAGGDLAPARGALRLDFDEQNAAVVGAAKAGLEKMHQRHADFTESDTVDDHDVVSREDLAY
jgi:hypothetical protein